MLTVHHPSSRVQPDWREIARDWSPEATEDVEPFMSPEDVELGFTPSPEDDAWWAGFSLAYEGERAYCPTGPGYTRAIGLRFALGTLQGRMARESDEARELGQTLGVISDLCCPPPGFAAHQALAYREGFAAGRRESEEAVKYEAMDWHHRSGMLEDALGDEIGDESVYFMGGVS